MWVLKRRRGPGSSHRDEVIFLPDQDCFALGTPWGISLGMPLQIVIPLPELAGDHLARLDEIFDQILQAEVKDQLLDIARGQA